MDQIDDIALRAFLKLCPEPMAGLRESDNWLGFLGVELAIHKRDSVYTTGWVMALPPSCFFLRRWFDYPDMNRRGWAVIFRLYPPNESGPRPAEYFGGWVPADQEAEADAWIARLNVEIRARLAAGEVSKPPAELAKPSSKEPIRLVGNFREMGDPTPGAPSLVDARGKRPPANKQEVLTYLRKAPVISFSPGLGEDFFEPKRHVKGHTLRTDGSYVWPDFLADYVERYDVELPGDFEVHMRARAWTLPEGLDIRTLRLPWWDQGTDTNQRKNQ